MRAPKLRAESLREAARLFGLDAADLALVNAGVNEVYRAPGVYLKFGPQEYFDGAKQLGATSFLAHAFARGAPVSEPLFSSSGNLIETVWQDGETWQVTLAREVPGERLDPLNLTKEQVRAWGRALGQLHEAARSLVPPRSALIKDFYRMWADIEPVLARHDPALLPIHRELTAWQATLPRDADVFGIIHGDTRAGNALWTGHNVTVIDFDEPCWHFFAGDLARPLLECGRIERAALLPHLLAGYREVRALPTWLAHRLPNFMRERALIMYGWSLEGPPSGEAAHIGFDSAAGLNSSGARPYMRFLRRHLLRGDF